MKKSTIRRLLVLCLCLTLVTVSLIGGTLAKYTYSVSGTATGTVATWVIDSLNDQNASITETFEVKLNDGDVIIPGDEGSFTITVKNTSNIDATLKAPTLTTTSVPSGFTITCDVTQDVSLTANTGEKEIVFSWEYDATVAPTDPSISVPISFTVEQTDSTAETNITDTVTAVTTP